MIAVYLGNEDRSISKAIDNIARCAIASHFRLRSSAPEAYNREYKGTGFALSGVHRSDPVFRILLDRLSRFSATFHLNNNAIARTFSNGSFLVKMETFGNGSNLELSSMFAISLKQGDSEPGNISGSPYTTIKLFTAQGLNAHFGRVHHGKREI